MVGRNDQAIMMYAKYERSCFYQYYVLFFSGIAQIEITNKGAEEYAEC
jgi:hypothetical protein